MTDIVLADTFYCVALLSPIDGLHRQAIALTAKLGTYDVSVTQCEYGKDNGSILPL